MIASSPLHIVQVALPTPLRRVFDYAWPDALAQPPTPGVRVKVPFGKRELIGIVVGEAHESDVPSDKLKPVIACFDTSPMLRQADLQLAHFAARYYHHPIGDVIAHMLPTYLRQGKTPDAVVFKERDTSLETPLTLNPEQQAAFEQISATLNQFQVTLLQGVTGSGKTEVYAHVMQSVIEAGKQVLVLVPEIGLTPQTLKRFQARFGERVAMLHSNVSQKKRAQTWLAAQLGEMHIIIGTRSAVFTPMPNLGLIVLDEEHDGSFKSQDGFRYHARDLAIWRAHQANVPIILGSATPSFETLHNVNLGKYQKASLTHQAATHHQSPIHLIDLRNKKLEGGLSDVLLKKIQATLDKKEQSLLFLNRRGYAPTWLCHTCGWVATCHRCDARLTYHQGGRLHCHHCDYQTSRLKRCKECGSESNILLGEGTQRLEETLQQHFPSARITRIDRDATRKKEALHEMLEAINHHEYDILLGTQMLTKGHHFPLVTLVGVIDADNGLLSSDFRAIEKTAQLLTQVAGRAGRESPGEVFIQTHQVDHPLLQTLLKAGYEALAHEELASRERMHLPPHGHLALIRAESSKAMQPMQYLQSIRQFLSPLTAVQCMGPIPAPMEKKQGKFRAQLLITSRDRAALQHALSQCEQAIDGPLAPKAVRLSLDVDPQDMT